MTVEPSSGPGEGAGEVTPYILRERREYWAAQIAAGRAIPFRSAACVCGHPEVAFHEWYHRRPDGDFEECFIGGCPSPCATARFVCEVCECSVFERPAAYTCSYKRCSEDAECSCIKHRKPLCEKHSGTHCMLAGCWPDSPIDRERQEDMRQWLAKLKEAADAERRAAYKGYKNYRCVAHEEYTCPPCMEVRAELELARKAARSNLHNDILKIPQVIRKGISDHWQWLLGGGVVLGVAISIGLGLNKPDEPSLSNVPPGVTCRAYIDVDFGSGPRVSCKDDYSNNSRSFELKCDDDMTWVDCVDKYNREH